MATEKGKALQEAITIKAPNLRTAMFRIVGTAPYVQHAFGQKALLQMRDKQAEGSTAKSKKVREAKDFDAAYKNATHFSTKGWIGIPASSFRNAMISACRLVGFKMTLAKLSVFIEADGFGEDGTPLVKIEGKPVRHIGMARNATGVVDVRCRPMWKEWSAPIRVRFDGDVFTLTDIGNLLSRVGEQVGIGEGRPDSKMSAGVGWGTFRVEAQKKTEVA